MFFLFRPFGFEENAGIASVLSSHSQESGQFETYSYSSQTSANLSANSSSSTPTPVQAKKEMKPQQKSMSKWESEEALGDKATIAPMLFANTKRGDLIQRYPGEIHA